MTKPKKKNRFKLPNGFGSIIYRTDGNRRKPWEVRKTINGKQRVLDYFPTYEDAIGFLVAYNKDPSLFTPQHISLTSRRLDYIRETTENSSHL